MHKTYAGEHNVVDALSSTRLHGKLKRFKEILRETNIQLNDVVMLIDPQPIPVKIFIST